MSGPTNRLPSSGPKPGSARNRAASAAGIAARPEVTDAGNDDGGPLSGTYRALTIGLLAIITCAAFEAMAVATAMPVVAADLDGEAGYGLAFSMYLTASLLGTVLAGSWCDRSGPRPALPTGLALMVGGLVISGAAGGFVVLTLGRAVSGLGGGLMIVAVYVIIGQVYPLRAQPVVFGWMAAAWVLPALIGPIVAGRLAEHASWRWVFFGVSPIVLAAVVLVWPSVRALRAPPGSGTDRAPARRGVLCGAGLAGGVFGVQWALFEFANPDGEFAASQLVLLAAVVVVGVVLAGLTLPTLLPAGTLRLAAGMPSVIATRGMLNLVFFAAESFIPLMLVMTHGMAAGRAGLALSVGSVGWAVGSFAQARARVERHRLLVGGSAILSLSMAGLALFGGPQTPFWILLVVWAVAGFAMGIGLSTTSVMVLKISPPAERGKNSAALQLADQLGGVIGAAGAGTVFALLYDPQRPQEMSVFVVIWVALAVLTLGPVAAGARSAGGRPAPSAPALSGGPDIGR